MRAQEHNVLNIPCNVGIDQSYGTDLAPPGTFQTVTNCRMVGGSNLRKRFGITAVPAAVGGSAGRSVIAGDGTTSFVNHTSFLTQAGDRDVVGISSGAAFTRDESGARFLFSGRFSSAQPTQKRNFTFGSRVGVAGGGGWGRQPASVAVNTAGYVMMAAISDDSSLALITIESQEGARLWNMTIAAEEVKVCSTGAAFTIVILSGTTLTAYNLTISSSIPALGSGQTIGTLVGATAYWDISAAPTGTAEWFLVYQNGAAQCTVKRCNTTPASVASQTFAVTGTVPLSIWADSQTSGVWVGYYNDPAVTGDVKYLVYTLTLGALKLAATTIASGADVFGPPLIGSYRNDISGKDNTTRAFCVYKYRATATPYTYAAKVAVLDTDGNISATGTIAHATPISKPDSWGRFWVYVDNTSGNSDFSRVALLRVPDPDYASSTGECVVELSDIFTIRMGDFGPGAGAGLKTRYGYFNAIAEGGSSSSYVKNYFAGPYPLRSKLSTTYEAAAAQVVYEYTSLDVLPHCAALRVGQSVIASGSPTQLFGQPYAAYSTGGSNTGVTHYGAAEIGFLQAPVITAVASSGAGNVDGAVEYVAVYEWSDHLGQLHRSRPSEPVAFTASTDTVSVTVTSSEMTQRTGGPLTVVTQLYRTLAGGVQHMAAASITSTGSGVYTISDNLADASIVDNEILYTDGGVLPHDLAPSCRFMCKSEDRVWFGGLWDRSIIQCSKVIVPNEPVQCTQHESHQVTLLDDCTGLAYMDGAVVVFAKDSIYAVSGDGPNDQGIGGFPPPRLICRGVGCVAHQSILETQHGVLFLSANGFYLLPRGFGSPVFIGAKIQDEFALRQFCLSAATLASASVVTDGVETVAWNLARFLMDSTLSGSTGSNDILTYDLNNGAWLKDEYTTSGADRAFSELGVWSNGFAYGNFSLSSAAGDGNVLFEDDDSAYVDAGSTYMETTLRTNWIRPFGPNGWGVVKRFVASANVPAAGNSNSIMSLTITPDGGTAQSATFTMTGSEFGYRELIPVTQKLTAVQLVFQDKAGASPGAYQGMEPVCLSLEIESAGGLRLLAPEERA